MDGGIRSGQDVAKALACGAKAVMLGRPWAYGLAARGEAGVAEVLAILKRELEVTMTPARRGARRRHRRECDRSLREI
jgi:L-lactate dehydrogenase (cytochrome)